MTVRIKCDKIISGKNTLSAYVYAEDGVISDICDKERPADEEYDFSGCYLIPGFVEIHSHGAGGYPFITNDETVVARACDFHLKHGTTTILPTVSAAPIEIMRESCAAIARAAEKKLSKANVRGAHLEGPYLSAKQCGAQCTDFITPPIEDDYHKLIEEYGRYIARWTYAPESDANGNFAKFLKDNDIIASAGHTNATWQDMHTAIKNGMNLVTHLYSCTSTVTRNMGFRALGVIESTFLSDEITAEIIADGKHLPKELVQMIIKIKGADKVIAVTDSLEIAGTDIKEGVMSGTPFIVEDGVCKLHDRSAFAGSIATSDVLMRFLIGECGIEIHDAVRMMCENPSKLLNLNCGKIDTGYAADLVVLDDGLNVGKVFVAGCEV